MWLALLWKYKQYVAAAVFVIGLVSAAKLTLNAHDKNVRAEAVHIERMAELNQESNYVNSLIQDYNAIIDSITTVNEQEKQKRTEVREHSQKLVKVQEVAQSKVDSFVTIARDSATRAVVDSLSWLHKVVVARLNDRLRDADIMYHSLELELKRKDAVIELKNTQLNALEDFNKKLHADLATNPPTIAEHHGESIGHFIIHKAAPVVFIAYGVGRTIHEFKARK